MISFYPWAKSALEALQGKMASHMTKVEDLVALQGVNISQMHGHWLDGQLDGLANQGQEEAGKAPGQPHQLARKA